jgi:Cu/Ag efflux protein CusF
MQARASCTVQLWRCFVKFVLAGLFVVALAACSQPSAPAPAPVEAAPAEAAAPVVRAKAAGEVVSVSPADGAVTVRHGAIPEYGMGAMTMEFTTETPDQLKDVAVGDQVEFELKGPTEIDTITVVKKP